MLRPEVEEALQSVRVVCIDKVADWPHQLVCARRNYIVVVWDREQPLQEFVCADPAPVTVEPANGRQGRAGQVVNDSEMQFGWQGGEGRLRFPDDLKALRSVHFLVYLQSWCAVGCVE